MFASRIFSTMAAFLSMVTLGPKTATGFVDVPFPGATGLATMIGALLGVDLAFLEDSHGLLSFRAHLIGRGDWHLVSLMLFPNDNSFSGWGGLHYRDCIFRFLLFLTFLLLHLLGDLG